MTRYVKKAVTVDAMRLGTDDWDDVFWEGVMYNTIILHMDQDPQYVEVLTPHGRVNCFVGSWIIKGVNGEFYPCDHDTFMETYVPAEDVEPDFESFSRDIMKWWPEDRGDIDMFDLQNLAKKHGLIREVEGGFNPEIHEDIYGDCEPGDPWFEITYQRGKDG